MKKQLLGIAFGLTLLSTHYTMAQVMNPEQYIELNKLKYGSQLVPVGDLNVAITDKLKLAPDTVEFSIQYITEASTPVEASTLNDNHMKQLKSYLEEVGLTQKDYSTIGYRSYEQTKEQTDPQQAKLYKTLITINAVIKNNDQFYNAIQILEKNGISNLEKQKDNGDFYTFTIEEKASDANASKELAQAKYKTIEGLFNKAGITQLSIEKYHNNPDTSDKQQIKQFYVENTLQIRTKNFDHIGKIFAKAQSLKMSINNDMRYSVSTDAREQAIAKSQSKLLEKLTEKAKTLLGTTGYKIGAPKNLHVSESDAGSIQPRYNHALEMGSAALYKSADSIDIQPPSEFEIIVNLSGSFDILKDVHKTNE